MMGIDCVALAVCIKGKNKIDDPDRYFGFHECKLMDGGESYVIETDVTMSPGVLELTIIPKDNINYITVQTRKEKTKNERHSF